jgi:hypothetical protein
MAGTKPGHDERQVIQFVDSTRPENVLNRPAMQLPRSVEMRVKRSRNAAHEKARVIRQSQRGTVDFDDAVGNQVLGTGRRHIRLAAPSSAAPKKS